MAAALRILINRWLNARAAKPLVFLLALVPMGCLLFGAVTGQLGPNPAEALVRSSGDWTLRFLCVALAVTPVRLILGLAPLARLRRMLGLFVFFYAALHFLAYSWLDKGRGYRQASFYSGRLRVASAFEYVGGDIVERRGASPGCAAVAASAPGGVFDRRLGDIALFLDACRQE